MKIAVLGNMNNNGFALMRYLRDIGQEADLLLFDDDEDNYSSHFSLKADTWHLEKWKKYVKKSQLQIVMQFLYRKNSF